MKRKQFHEMKLGNFNFPVQIIEEYRRNGRVSLASKEIIIRIPTALSSAEKNRTYQWAQDYLKHLYETRPEAFEKYIPVNYSEKRVLSTFCDDIQIRLKSIPSARRVSGQMVGNILEISMPDHLSANDPMLGDLIAKILRKKYLPVLDLRVRELNEKHLDVPLERVKMRNSSTRWGSCSSGRNISISTRALLTPESVLNYILVHELCHLREMNHSAAFWNLVSSIDPTYKEKEVWLRRHGGQLKF